MTTVLEALKALDFPDPAPLSADLLAPPIWQVRRLKGGAPLILSAQVLLGLPDVTVIASNTLARPADLLSAASCDPASVLFIEDPRLYPCELLVEGQADLQYWAIERDRARYPAFTLRPEYPPAVTLATYGYNFELARAAALALIVQREIFCEIILFSQLSPIAFAPLAASLASTRRLVTIETDSSAFGWGAELIARAAELDLRRLKTRRVALASEASVNHLPIMETILNLLGQK